MVWPVKPPCIQRIVNGHLQIAFLQDCHWTKLPKLRSTSLSYRSVNV